MKKYLLLLILGLLFSVPTYSQLSQSQVDAFFERFNDRITRMDELFDQSLLTKVPASQLIYIRDDFLNKYGNYVKSEILSGNQVEVYYEKAVFPCTISFEPGGQVSSLWFGAPSFQTDNIEQIKQELNALKGVVSVCIRKDGRETFSLKKDIPLAIGSSFKLYVLKAILYKIAGKELNWNDDIIIREQCKSLPSGILQNWPDNESLTIRSAVNLMISISDNTATDLLIDRIGREYIEKFAPSSMQPFYKTKELFVIKLSKDSSYVNWFIHADIETKRKELQKLDTVDITKLKSFIFTSPKYVQLEWYATTEELCKTIESLDGASALSINTGFINKDDWFYIAYKGGSEPGVLNYTYLLQKKDTSPKYSISVTVNDNQDIVDNDNQFTLLVKRIIDILEKNSQ